MRHKLNNQYRKINIYEMFPQSSTKAFTSSQTRLEGGRVVTSGLGSQGQSAVLPFSLSMSHTLWTLPFIALATSAVLKPPALLRVYGMSMQVKRDPGHLLLVLIEEFILERLL